MNKTVRIVLYVLSILTLIGVIAAFVLAGNKAEQTGSQMPTQPVENQPADDVDESEVKTESTVTKEEDTKTEETEQLLADGQTTEEDNTEDITLILTGDVLFANAFLAGYDANGIAGVVADNLLEQLTQADVLIVNNEFPFSTRGTQMADKQFTFRCDPSYVKGLTDMGVDMVSLANNHTLDYGKEALQDTFSTLDGAGILYGGAGDTIERAQAVQTMEVNGKKIGFLAVSRVIPTADWKVENSAPGIFSCYDETRLIELVQEAKKECDFLIVYPHWGVEYDEKPQSYQTNIAQKCTEAGADLIVGSHTHCLQGIEYMNGKPVFYSLGNFIFGQNIERSAAVKVTITADGTAFCQLLPIYAAGGVTQIMDDTAAAQLYSYMEQISVNAGVGENGVVTEQ